MRRRVKDPIVAIVTADLHLDSKPPISRSQEDWWEAMARPLEEINKLQTQCSKYGYPVPVIVCGDVFHKWNPPAELINFALRYVNRWLGIPGQHDLPYHSYEDRRRSGFWTLVQAGRIIPLEPGEPVEVGSLRLHGFPWGSKVYPLEDPFDLYLEVAVIHSYVWTKTTGYNGAPKEQRVGHYLKDLKGYDVSFFGDNHVPFHLEKEGRRIVNCGSLMRRNSDQMEYRPAVWLLHSSGVVEPHYLDCAKDVLIRVEGEEKLELEADAFLQELRELQGEQLSFEEAILRGIDGLEDRTKQVVLKALEKP